MSMMGRRLQRVSTVVTEREDPLPALIISIPPSGTSPAPSGPMVGTSGEFDYTQLATNEIWDNFDGTTLDDRLWQRDTINQGGTQVYQEDNMYLDGSGSAIMECTRPASTIYSGRFTSRERFAMKYGWCAARIKMPESQGSVGRAWFPAFWLLMVDYNISEYYAEFDIIEQFGDSSTYSTHLYTNDGNGNDLSNEAGSTDANSEYRTYWMLWEPERIRIGVDQIQIGDWSSADMDPGVWVQHFQQPMYYIVNFAAAPNWLPTPQASDFPAQMAVDWVWYKPLSAL